MPETLERARPVSVEAASPTAPKELRADVFSTSALESGDERAPFSFTLMEKSIARAVVRCIRSQAFVCSGDERFPFFLRLPNAADLATMPIGELTIETVRFEMRPQVETTPANEPRIIGYEVHGPTQVVAALETDAPEGRIWLGPRLAPNLRRAVVATAFAWRLHRLLGAVPPPALSQPADSP